MGVKNIPDFKKYFREKNISEYYLSSRIFQWCLNNPRPSGSIKFNYSVRLLYWSTVVGLPPACQRSLFAVTEGQIITHLRWSNLPARWNRQPSFCVGKIEIGDLLLISISDHTAQRNISDCNKMSGS